MAYTKQTWQNEVLSGVSADQALFTIKNSGGTIINDDVIIELKSTEVQAGSEFTADRMNHIEDGIEANSAAFNASTGHDHDGTDSKKIAYANITGTPTINKWTLLWSGTANSGLLLTTTDYAVVAAKYELIALFGAGGAYYGAYFLLNAGAANPISQSMFTRIDGTTLSGIKITLTWDGIGGHNLTGFTPVYDDAGDTINIRFLYIRPLEE